MTITHLVIGNSDGYRIGFLRLPIKNFLGDQHIFSSPLGLHVKLGFKISTCLRVNSRKKNKDDNFYKKQGTTKLRMSKWTDVEKMSNGHKKLRKPS